MTDEVVPLVKVTMGEPVPEEPVIDKKEIRTLKLKVPIEIRDAQTGDVKNIIDELKFPRAQVKHLEAMDEVEGETKKMRQLVCALTGHPPHVIKAMDAIDLEPLSELLGDFLGFSPVKNLKSE